MTGPEENSEFCFPRIEGNIEIRDIEIRFPKTDFTFLNLSLIQYYIITKSVHAL